MNNIVSGLYNFLDKESKGFVTFYELLKRSYPQLTEKDMILIRKWMEDYEKIISIKEKGFFGDMKKEKILKKKKIIPHVFLKRILEVFHLYDTEKKGCNKFYI